MGQNPGDQITYQLPFVIQPNIGLDENNRRAIIAILNSLLSDETILVTKTHCMRWNVHGTAFFELRAVLADQSQQLCAFADALAERVRMLGGFAIGTLHEFLDLARIPEQGGEVPEVMRLLVDHETIIRLLREDAKRCLEEYDDDGTRALLVDAIRAHEKIAWMLRSFIETDNIPADLIG